MHKITSFDNNERKILTQKFWYHGTSLGYLGPESLGDARLGPCRLQFLIIWGSYDTPVVVALQVHSKNLKSSGAWCDIGMHSFWNFDNGITGYWETPRSKQFVARRIQKIGSN